MSGGRNAMNINAFMDENLRRAPLRCVGVNDKGNGEPCRSAGNSCLVKKTVSICAILVQLGISNFTNDKNIITCFMDDHKHESLFENREVRRLN